MQAIIIIILAPFVLLYEWLKTPLTTKLHRLDDERPQLWGDPISEQVCPQCQAVNEGSRHSCFNCESTLPAAAQMANNSGDLKDWEKFMLVALGVFIFFMILAGISGGF